MGTDSEINNASNQEMFQSKKESSRLAHNVKKVNVKAGEKELEFSIKESTTGKQLFDQVTTTIGLQEVWFFGLQYNDSTGKLAWLNLNKTVSEQDKRLAFNLCVKFYPEDIVEELHQNITLRLFYLHIKGQIIQDTLFCPPESSVLLAAYSLQASDGDYFEEQHSQASFNLEKHLCPRISSQYKLSVQDWKLKIYESWIELQSMTQREAMIEYLKLCQELDMYGVTYFDIRNKKGSDLYLGVISIGLNVYESSDMFTPKVGFQWSEIRDISFSGKKFVIKSIDKQTENFVFYVQDMAINQYIISLCMGNHELYLRRRQPETPEVTRLKQQIEEERLKEQMDYLRLVKENEERQAYEAKQRDYEDKLSKASEVIQSKNEEIAQIQKQLQELENQLAELSNAKRELQVKEEELTQLNQQLQSVRAMGEEERQRSTNEVKDREEQIAKMKEQIESATTKTNNLQREVSQRRISIMPSIAENPTHSDPVRPSVLNASESRVQQAIRQFDPARPSIVNWNVQQDDDTLRRGSITQRSNARMKTNIQRSTVLKFDMPKDNGDQAQVVNRNWDGNVKSKLEAISDQLKEARTPDAHTKFDKLHEENKRAGRTRRNTLLIIQSGNTKSRVKQFEIL